ncbi:LysR family transcriptional regulator [Moritella sp. F3]|uniref:LysR family transcriptional regulator n=1 Tax=Moritella sp. F3 TaxID=2718882 RepID=UPI0018E10E2E|nr:LysR family transcriptional regulator [Moritella sp. F3]GIC77557.1 LysR family transcriptional regulator [Moritella sp. F1]GIC80018.1 LysR family transcriptional regulator [Moritella sp. F3]
MKNSIEFELSRIDLNLIVSLNVLLKERNVSRAAEQMCVSQSAMSRTLAKLRDMFNDELFIRTSNGISPTPKASELELLITPLLSDLHRLLIPKEFDPFESEAAFNLSVPTYISSFLMPCLIGEVMKVAPTVSVTEANVKSNPFPLLDAGELDFAMHYAQESHPKYFSEHLGHIYPIVYARKEHPLFDGEVITIESLLSYPFISMNVEESQSNAFTSPIHKLLELSQKFKKPVLRSSQTQILLDVAGSSDALLFGSNLHVDYFQSSSQLLPIYSFENEAEYHIDLFLIQHERNRNNSTHKWFKSLMLNQLRELLTPNAME